MLRDIPDCYEADRQEEARQLAYTAKVMRRPRCECCQKPLLGETYLDLEPFGLRGFACERCVAAHTRYVDDLEDG